MNNADQSAMPLHPNMNPSMGPAGLTKREYFAAKAMQGSVREYMGWGVSDWEQRAAKDAVRLADALLKELEK